MRTDIRIVHAEMPSYNEIEAFQFLINLNYIIKYASSNARLGEKKITVWGVESANTKLLHYKF